MKILLSFLIVIFLYPVLTLIFCSIHDYYYQKERIIIPIKALIQESTLQFFVFAHLPFELIIPWEAYRPGSDKFVFLLPGYTETKFIFRSLVKRLRNNEIGYEVVKYRPFLGDLVQQAERLKKEVEELHKKYPKCKIHIVGHSMGGLIGRYYLENNPTAPIESFVMVATPNRGTWLSAAAVGNCAKQMTPKSTFLLNLKNTPLESVTNIYSKIDSLICPRSSCKYHVNNYEVDRPTLHNSMMFNQQVIGHIINRVKNGKLA